MNFADEIKQRVSMIEMLQHYGIETNRSNFCRCPFHQEKSASFKAYPGSRGFYCYGCHESGSVIDFIMKFFGLSFGDAIKKINEDFSLGLPIGEKLDSRKQLEMNRQAFIRKREMNAKKAEQEGLENAYWEAFDECGVLVEYSGIAYQPYAYELKFQPDGKIKHTAILKDPKANCLVYCRLEDVKEK